jgi:acetylornithine deacetylase
VSERRAVLDHIRELIGTPSVSSVSSEWDMPNAPVIAQLAERLTGNAWHVEVMDIPGKPGKQNLLATLGKARNGTAGGLVLAGHTDTVPCDERLWSSDPFTLTERDNRLYGLGTADMKSFLALALAATDGIDPAKLKQPVILVATADEESSMAGARALVAAAKPRARYAVIGEPTGLVPIRMHKGIFMESIKVHGQSGHSSDPDLGNSALEGMHKVIAALLEWRVKLQTERDKAFQVPFSTMNLGHIHGGDNPNRICGDCELQVDLRFIPGLNRAELRSALQKTAAAAVQDSGLEISFESLFDGTDPMNTPATARIVEITERLTGQPAASVAYATEAPFLTQLGIETVVMGPGSINQAHQPDEYLALDQLEPTIRYLQELIKEVCFSSE